jgi:glycosyltransferase involved in cell wall biosynthesis
MKILIYSSSLTAGGAEKVASLMANYWAQKHHVILLTDTPVKDDFFSLDPLIERVTINFSTVGEKIVKKMFYHFMGLLKLRTIIKKSHPDIIISHMDNSNVRILLSSIGLRIPVIIEEHNNPNLATKMPQPWRFFQPFTYKYLATIIVLLTKKLIRYYPDYLTSKIRIIPNPLNIPTPIPDSTELILAKPTFIALGSLCKQKGFDYLLEAFAQVSKVKPEWKLTILGEGELRAELTEYAIKLNIADKVSLPGRIKNPYSILKDADIYVMSSRFEGFPVALCEAMGIGLPCISFDCPTGPADIIEHNINGLLVEYLNVNSLAETMISLSSDPFTSKRLSHEALKINETLDISTIMSYWDQIINIDCKVDAC